MQQPTLHIIRIFFLINFIVFQNLLPAQNCEIEIYNKTITSPGEIIRSRQIVNNNQFLFISFWNETYNFCITKTDFSSNPSWMKIYQPDGQFSFYDIVATQDGGIVRLGRDTDELGIIKLDTQGNIQWSKRYASPNWIGKAHIIQEENGEFIVASAWDQPDNNPRSCLLMSLDADGNILWTNYVERTSTNDFNRFIPEQITPAPDGGYLITGKDLYAMMLMKVDENGNTVWLKRNDIGTVNLSTNTQYLTAVNEQQTGYYIFLYSYGTANDRSHLLEIDILGNVVKSKEIISDDFKGAGHMATLPSGNIVISGLPRINTNSSEAMMLLDTAFHVLASKAIGLANPFIGARYNKNFGTADENIYLVDNYQTGTDEGFYVQKISADLDVACTEENIAVTLEDLPVTAENSSFFNYTVNIEVQDLSVDITNFEIEEGTICEATINAETVFGSDQQIFCAGDPATVNGITYSVDTIVVNTYPTNGPCDSIHTTTLNFSDAIQTQETISLYEGNSALVNGNFVSAAGTYATTFSNQSGCDSTHTVTVNVYTQGCEIEVYNKTIFSPGRLVIPQQIETYGPFLFLSFGNGIDRFGITKTDLSGNPSWMKRYRPDSRYRLSDMLATSNGGFIHMGTGNDKLKIIRSDFQGEILWSKSYGLQNEVNRGRIIEKENGDFLVMISSDAPGSNHSCVLMRIDQLGNIIWQNDVGSDATIINNLFIPANITEAPDGGYLITGRELTLMTLMKVDENGNTVWLKRYDIDTRLGYVTVLNEAATGYYIFQYSIFNSTNLLSLLEIDLLGNVVKSKEIISDNFRGGGQIATLPFGKIIISGKLENTNNSEAMILLDTDFNVLASKAVGAPDTDTDFPMEKNFVTIGEDIYLNDNYETGSEDGFYLQKISADLGVACQDENFSVTLEDISVPQENIPFFNRAVNIEVQDFSVEITDYQTEENTICEATVIQPPVYAWDLKYFCEGDSTNINGTIFTSDTLVDNTYQSSIGCDSIHTTALIFQPPQFTFEDLQICDASSTIVDGQTIFSDTTLYSTLQTNNGCDSIHQINIAFGTNKSTNEYQQYCQGSTINIFGNPINFSGTYTETYTAFDGCDSTHAITAEFKNNLLTVDLQDYCEGEPAMVGGTTYFVDTILFENNTSFWGCDSTHRTTLRFLENVEILEEITACDGDTIPVFNLSISRDTFLTRSTVAPNGCDSIWSVNISFLETIQTNETITSCEGDTITVFGNPVFQDTTDSQTFTSIGGCDSTHTITVVFNSLINTSETVGACQGDTLTIFGNPVIENGLFSETYISSLNCDSTHQIEVVFNDTIKTFETQTYCEGMTVPVFWDFITSDTTVSQTYPGFNNCDSTHQIEVIFLENINTTEILQSCIGETVTIFGNPIMSNGIFSETYTAANGCDSNHQITINFSNMIQTSENLTACEGEMVMVFGNPIFQDTTESQTFTSVAGCDSIHTINAIFNTQINTEEILEACEGEILSVFGNTVTQNGIFTETYLSTSNCDSTHQVTLVFSPVSYGQSVATYCAGEVILINGMPISSDQDISLLETGINGCDSIHILSIQFVEENLVTDTVHLCADEFTLFFGDTIRTAGNYKNLLPAADSQCDTIYELTITVSERFSWSLPDTIFATNGIRTSLPFLLENNELTIVWNNSQQLNCIICTKPTIDPQYDEWLNVMISDETGCSTSDRVFLKVEQATAYYIPNVFSPNGDQINDRFSVSGNSKVQAISSMQIYNRWGAVVYQGFNFPINDTNYGWDGNFKGQAAPAGVYVYMVELILADDTIVLASGDLTLVR